MTSLLDSIPLGPTQRLRNRIALAPLTNRQSHPDGSLGDEELRWLERRARDGFGLIISCATHVTRDGQGFPHQLGIFDDALIGDWRRLAAAVQQHGAPLLAQIFHAGIRSPRELIGDAPLAPSAPTDNPNGVRELTVEDIERIEQAFIAAAVRAHTAGVAGVEIHGAHGYLLTQFLSSDANRRTDGWGGSLENRARVLRTIAQGIRAATPRDFIVGVRLSPENWGPWKGLDLDESVQVAQWLAEDGVDFVHLSLWDAGPNTAKYPDRHAVEVFRNALPAHVALLVAGHIWTKDEAQRLLDLGADVVALGRAAICNPDWPETVAKGSEVRRPPMTPGELAARDVSPAFVEYLRNWKGFVEP